VAIPKAAEALHPSDRDSLAPRTTGGPSSSSVQASSNQRSAISDENEPTDARDFGEYLLKSEENEKLDRQIPERGWSHEMISETIREPAETYDVRDTSWAKAGEKLDAPATACVREDGSYVVVTDTAGFFVQVSGRDNVYEWGDPWDEES